MDAKIKKVETQLQWYDDDEKMVANIKQQQALVEKARQTSQIAINIHFIFPLYRLTLIPPPSQSEQGGCSQ